MEEEMLSTVKNTSEVYRTNLNEKTVKADMYTNCKIESTDGEDVDSCHSWIRKPREHIQRSNDEECSNESKVEPHTNSSPIKRPIRKHILIEETSDQEFDLKSKRLKHDIDSFCPLHRNETIHKRCLSDEEHCYTGRSPTGSVTGFPFESLRIATGSVVPRDQRPSCINKIRHVKPERCQHYCSCSELGTQLSSEHAHTSCEERINDKILTKKKKWKKQKGTEQMTKLEQKLSHPVDERLPCAKTPKPSVPNQCTASKRKVKRRKVKEGNTLPLAKKIKNEPHAGPSFKLICTNLDDLRELINKTEDELDVLESTKKKMNQWYCRREAVKDLHSTLVRLLNELTPWEPKLIKAYQRNRLRLKKEFEDFRSHPEFFNFVREKSISSSATSSSSSDDEEGELGFEQCSQSAHEDSEHILPWVLRGSVKDLSTELSADIPVTHISYNHQKISLSTTSVNSDHTLKNTCKSEQNHQTVKSGHSYSVQLQTIPLLKPNFLHTASRQPKSCTPIPTLLAKSVGNKVTLMKQPADHLEIDSINGDSKGTVVSTGDINLFKLKNYSSGPQKHDVFYTVHKESNHLVGSTNSKLRCEEIKPQQVCASTNVAGFTIPVQKVPPSKNTGLTETSLCSSNSSQPSVINSTRSKGTQHCDGQTSTPQYILNNITSAPSSLSKSTDSKQELKTVCIRESQSILVTTRGGNTGIVQVQKSFDHTGGTSKSPIITISPQFQAFLVSKTSPVYSSNTAQCDKISTASTGSEVQATAETPSISQEVNKYLSTTKCQGLTGSSGYTSTLNPGKPISAVSCPLAVVKNVNPSLNSSITSPSLTAADLISKPNLNQTNQDNGSHIAKFVLISPSSHDVNVSCTKTPSASVKRVNQHTANSSLIPIQSNNTVQTQATTTVAIQQVMETSSAPSKMSIHTSSVNSVSIAKNKGVFVTSGTSTGTSTDPIQFPCLITTTIPQNTQSSTTCHDTEPMVTTTTQTVFTNSNVIFSVPAPATSLLSLKHLGISSITINSQPRNVTRLSTKSLSAENLQKKHGFSNILRSSNLKVQQATSQSTINSISALGLKHKFLNNPFMSNASGHVDETSLSPPLSFTRPEDSSAVHRSTTTSSATSTSSVQQQMVINTSTHLAGGTRIVLNNAHFVVPPQGLSPGSHVIVISGHAQKVPSTSVRKEATVPFQGENKDPVFLQPSTRLPCVPAVRSPFVACTSAVGCTVQAAIPIGSVPKPNGLNNMLVNKIDSVAKSQFFQTTNTGRPKASVVSTFPNIVPLVSTVLTNASTSTAASLGLVLPRESPPILSSNVLIKPIKADPAQLLNVAAISSSQGLMSPTRITKGLSEKSLPAEVPSPTIRVSSIYSSTSTALLHMGLGSVSFQKQEHPVSTTALSTQSAPPVMSPETRTLPCSGGHAEAVEFRPPSNSSTCHTAAPLPPYRESTTHCPVIVTNPEMENHLPQTSFLEMQNPVMSKLLLSPDGAVLSKVQCKAKTTLPETPAGLLISTAALQAEDLLLQPSHVNLKFDN